MQRIDVLIVGALLLAAAGSALAVVTYEDDRIGAFNVTWTTRETELDAEPVSHTGPGEVETTVEIVERNITRIAFTVLLSGGPARLQPTAILVEVVSPTNESMTAEGELPVGPTGTIEVPLEFELAPVPGEASVTGTSLDSARDALNATLSSSLGIGTWTVRASFAPSTPGLGGQEAHTLGARADVESYQGELALVGPEVGR